MNLSNLKVGQYIIIAAISYKEYKKQHPGTKKKESDTLFKKDKKESKSPANPAKKEYDKWHGQ